MALLLFLLAFELARAATTGGEMALTNITRFNFGGGDLFSIPGKIFFLVTLKHTAHNNKSLSFVFRLHCIPTYYNI